MFANDDVELIRKSIESSLRVYNIDSDVTVENFNKCIKVFDDNVMLWVRLLPMSDNRYVVDFSSIQLDKNLQRRGIFTSIFNSLKQCAKVGKLVVSSVCTDEMLNWCKSRGLSSLDDCNFYIQISE